MDITQEVLKDLFDYSDGKLIWKKILKGKHKESGVAGYFNKTYYKAKIKRQSFLLHRLIFLWHHGYMPEFVDHVDRDRQNNRIENLRDATKSQNIVNSETRKKATTIYKGVSKVYGKRALKKWRARINFNKKAIGLGYYNTEIEAALAYNKGAIELYGDFAFLNQIEETSKLKA